MPTRIYNTSGEFYSIVTRSYLDIPNDNTDILSSVESHLISGSDLHIQPKTQDELLIRIYEESTDIDYWVPLSRAFIDEMANSGYNILCMLGSGSDHTSFLAYDGNKFVTILIYDNLEGEYDEEMKQLLLDGVEFEKKVMSLPKAHLYLNTVYETLFLNIPYSDNYEYRRLSMPNYGNRPIHILEYLSYTLEEMLINKTKIWKTIDYQIFREQVECFLSRSLSYLKDNGYEYLDIKLDNIMVGYSSGISYLKLIDIESVGVYNDDITKSAIKNLLRDMDNMWKEQIHLQNLQIE